MFAFVAFVLVFQY